MFSDGPNASKAKLVPHREAIAALSRFLSRGFTLEPVQALGIALGLLQRRGLRPCGRNLVRGLPSERLPSGAPASAAVPDSPSEVPPVIRRAEVVAFALVGLLIISLVAVLYVAKAFFLPVVMA